MVTIVEVLASCPRPSGSLTSQFTPFLSALLGAGVAGTTAFWLQRRQFKHQNAQLDRDRLEVEETLGLSVLLKINRVHTNIVRVREHIDEGVMHVDKPDSLDLWAKVREFSSDLPRVEVSIEELVFVKKLGDIKSLDSLMDLQEINDSYVDALRLYGQLRKELADRMIAVNVAETVGDRVTTELNQEDLMKLVPDMSRLNKLLNDVRKGLDDHERSVSDLFRRIQSGAKAKLGEAAVQFDIPQTPTER